MGTHTRGVPPVPYAFPTQFPATSTPHVPPTFVHAPSPTTPTSKTPALPCPAGGSCAAARPAGHWRAGGQRTGAGRVAGVGLQLHEGGGVRDEPAAEERRARARTAQGASRRGAVELQLEGARLKQWEQGTSRGIKGQQEITRSWGCGARVWRVHGLRCRASLIVW